MIANLQIGANLRKQYYECHITIEGPRIRGPNNLLKNAVEALGWKYSVIDGDIVLGPGSKYYATKHFNSKHGKKSIISELLKTAEELTHYLPERNKIVRRKCELVVFDDKKSGQKCEGNCPECHLDDLTQ